MSLLKMSFSGAVLILAIVIIRAVAINKLPKKTFLVLWDIVLLRLLVPFSIPSMYSVYSITNQNAVIRTLKETPVGNIIPFIQGETFELTGEMSKLSTNHVSTWFVIWIMGMIICTAFFTISYIRCRFEFSASLPVHNDFVKMWLKEHNLKRPVSVKQTDRISAPLTYGIFKPVILVPKNTDWENTKQLQYIFWHEYMHICHYDTVIKLISALALCIHWFNPLVWVMYILFDRDIELSCDESVVGKIGISEKSTYANMLISMEAKKSSLIPFCNSFNKNAIEERIEAIMRMKKATLLSLGAAAIIVVGTVTTFATSAVENSTHSYNIDTVFDGDIDKDRQYSEYITKVIASEIKDISGIIDCEVDVSRLNGEFVSADVSVVTKEGETDDLKTDILDYVSTSLGIPTENITLSFDS